jgi:hypothetical protein
MATWTIIMVRMGLSGLCGSPAMALRAVAFQSRTGLLVGEAARTKALDERAVAAVIRRTTHTVSA